MPGKGVKKYCSYVIKYAYFEAHIVNLTFSCVVLADLKACLLLSELLDVPGQAGAGVTVRNMYSSLSNQGSNFQNTLRTPINVPRRALHIITIVNSQKDPATGGRRAHHRYRWSWGQNPGLLNNSTRRFVLSQGFPNTNRSCSTLVTFAKSPSRLPCYSCTMFLQN